MKYNEEIEILQIELNKRKFLPGGLGPYNCILVINHVHKLR